MRLGRRRRGAGFVGSAAALAVAVIGPPAAALESHFVGDDARVTIDAAGVAKVEHALAYRVSGGAPKGFDLVGIEGEAIVEPEAPVTFDNEPGSPAHVERKGDAALRITLDGAPRSEKTRGSHALVVRVRYAVDLARSRELTTDGAMWRIGWTAPVAPEGYDEARVVFDLPGAPTEPRAIALDGTASADGRVVTLRRGADRDELEMTRPHVARGEAAAWLARVDPRAFPRAVDPSLRPPPAPPPAPASHEDALRWLVAIVIGGAFASLVAAKSRAFARACASRGVEARAFVGWLPPAARAWLAGAALAAGIALEVAELPTWGALAVIAAMALAAHRAPLARSAPRGPGQWLALAPAEAFARDDARDPLDVTTRAGKWTAFFLALAVAAIGVALRRVDMALAWLAPLDALALLAVLATGTRAQLPPDRARAPARRLAVLHRALKRDATLRVAPWARVPIGASFADELRLLVLPRAPMPGVVGIEVGVAWVPTAAGYAPETEVLVRVREESMAAARMVTIAPKRRSVPGRKAGERVMRLLPAVSSRAGVVALVRRLASELRDRRKSLAGVSWKGEERRLPANERVRIGAAA